MSTARLRRVISRDKPSSIRASPAPPRWNTTANRRIGNMRSPAKRATSAGPMNASSLSTRISASLVQARRRVRALPASPGALGLEVFETRSSRKPASHASTPAASICSKVAPSTPARPRDYAHRPVHRAVPTTSASRMGAPVDCFPICAASPKFRRVGARVSTFEACSAPGSRSGGHSRYADISLNRPRRPLSRGFDPASRPVKPLISYQINRQLSGWRLPPLAMRPRGAENPSSLRDAFPVSAQKSANFPALKEFGSPHQNRTASPVEGVVTSPSHITRRPRTIVPTGQPVTVLPS
jgi:hypothetical protein